MPRPSTARRAERSTRPGRNSRGRHPHGHAGDGVPLAAFPGDASRRPRTPARQRDEPPWNPGLPPADRERRANHSASTRDCPAVSRPAGSRSGSVRWLPWVAITTPPLTCPVALWPVRPAFLGTCKMCICAYTATCSLRVRTDILPCGAVPRACGTPVAFRSRETRRGALAPLQDVPIKLVARSPNR